MPCHYPNSVTTTPSWNNPDITFALLINGVLKNLPSASGSILLPLDFWFEYS